MTDDVIIRLASAACENLSKMEFWMGCNEFMLTYNWLLQAAKTNHPKDEFLNSLTPLPVKPPDTSTEATGGRTVFEAMTAEGRTVFEAMTDVFKGKRHGEKMSPPRLKFLFSQLRIVLEASQTESSEKKQ
jgi:hypothetical protein